MLWHKRKLRPRPSEMIVESIKIRINSLITPDSRHHSLAESDLNGKIGDSRHVDGAHPLVPIIFNAINYDTILKRGEIHSREGVVAVHPNNKLETVSVFKKRESVDGNFKI
jgi:hypothetical protein